MDVNQYLEIFIEESKEHLENLNESLLSLEKNPNEKSLLNEIFRASHTLKGMASTMGFTKLANLTHEMENLLHALRNGDMKVNTEIIDVLFKCFDTIEEYVAYISENGEEGEFDGNELLETINCIMNNRNNDELVSSVENEDKHLSISNLNDYVKNVLEKAKEKGLYAYKIDVKLNDNCMLKSARAFVIFNLLEETSEIIQSIPSVEDIEDEKFDLSFQVVIISETEKEEIRKKVLNVSEVEKVEIVEINLVLSDEEKAVTTSIVEDNDVDDDEDDFKQELQNRKKISGKLGKTVRVDIDRLDNLMNLVSELIIIKTRMEDMSGTQEKQNMNEAIEYLERITTNLHDAVMKVRMVPIERVFNRFPRMVRDLSKELGKSINLDMKGKETEVDRTVIDEIGDPLIHLIRNSIDHGIENPEERIKSGKDKVGNVKLRAYPDGNNVVIEVEDDGKGIDIEKVRKKAIEKGLISQERASNLPKEEVINFLFSAGFSTASKITDISGRGVGLDVVKTKIEAIGGSVEVETEQGAGTKFIIRLPLTLAIIQALLINLKDEIYAIPLSSIKEISPINSKEIRKVQNQEVVLFRNKTLPIIRLNRVLGTPEDEEKEELITVVVKKGEKEAGLIVDNLIGQQEIVIKSLGKFLSGIKHIAGATILGNGQISLIIDVNSLF